MGKRHKDRNDRKQESKEERLLRKAKEFVEAESGDRKRKRQSDSDTDDQRGSRRHHRRGGEDRKRKHESRSDHKRRHKKESSHKREKESKRQKKDSRSKRDKARKPDKKSLIPLGEPLGRAPTQLLDPEKDYFAFHKHLFVFLYREEGLAFNDLSSEETHEAFGRFVKRYNRGDLEAAYYDPAGLPPAALEESKTTKHKWSFQTNDTEEKSLHLLQEGVRKQTEYSASGGERPPERQVSSRKPAPQIPEPPRRNDESAEDRYRGRVSNRRLREHVRTAEEEFGGGKKDGRERQIEKRKEIGERTHAAARDREAAVELTDDAIYGGDKGNFQAALAREKQRAARREEKRNDRFEELQKKEDDKKEAMLSMLGLSGIKPGEKIKIAPRKD